MPDTAKIVADFEAQLLARLEELQPAVDEYREVERMLRRLRDDSNAGGDRRPLGSGGRRAEQALALVRERPGITVAEIADHMGIGPTYLYRVLPALEREGQVEKVGKGYRPVTP